MANYVYDADGNRYSAASAGATTSYVVDTSLPYASVVEEYSNGTLAARYDYGDDLVRMDRGSGVYYYIYDGLGSTRQLVNIGGVVTDTWGYSAFGELASHTGSTVNPFLFNAQQLDGASGDYFLRARYYDQSVGRFISQDPYSGSNDDPVSLHRYLYASCDPVNRVDPSGRNDGLIGTLGAIGGLATLVSAELPALETEIPQAEEIATEASPILAEGEQAIVENAQQVEYKFTQITASIKFSDKGDYAGKTIGQLATQLRNNLRPVSQVPVEFIERNGIRLIVNTRSYLALLRANINVNFINFINRTGDLDVEAKITERLRVNNLTEEGTDVLRIGKRFIDDAISHLD